MSLLKKVILNQKISKSDIEYALYDICDNVHASCDSSCPVYYLNGGEFPLDPDDPYGCSCFKNGKAMLKFIKERKDKFDKWD